MFKIGIDNSTHLLTCLLGSHKSILGLFLVYPVLDQHLYRHSAIQYRNVNGMLTLDQMIWFWKLYLQGRDATDCSLNFKICPIYAPENILSQFPNTLIVLAKHDVLYSEGMPSLLAHPVYYSQIC